MNKSTSKLIRKFVSPTNTLAKKVYRRMKKGYNNLNAEQRFLFKEQIRKTIAER